MKIIDILKKKQSISFEFFPPKDILQESVLFDTINELKDFNPDFVSITYGAGGSAREKTLDWSKTLAESFNTMMHLTCYGNTPESITEVCRKLNGINITNVLALRGDLPKDFTGEIPKAFDYADGIVKHIRQGFPELCIGVAGYPEKHPAAASFDADIEHMKRKIDSGACFITTQLFFDNKFFYDYKEKLAKKNINVPVVAGIMPIVNAGQVFRFVNMCGSSIPGNLQRRIENAAPEDVAKIGEEYALEQATELLKMGAGGVHFYTLNKSPVVKNILECLL